VARAVFGAATPGERRRVTRAGYWHAGDVTMPPQSEGLRVTPLIRTPDQRLRVFVRSTLQELADARLATNEAIQITDGPITGR
jgi:hypothetical protein